MLVQNFFESDNVTGTKITMLFRTNFLGAYFGNTIAIGRSKHNSILIMPKTVPAG
jgi:hypothetical protein